MATRGARDAMTLDDYNAFCAVASLDHPCRAVGRRHVWKVGGKVFAIAGWSDGEALAVTFKTSEMAFDILREQPGCRPAPYLASRGMKWIQRQTDESMDDEALRDYLRESHRLVGARPDPQGSRRTGFDAMIEAEPNWLMRVL